MKEVYLTKEDIKSSFIAEENNALNVPAGTWCIIYTKPKSKPMKEETTPNTMLSGYRTKECNHRRLRSTFIDIIRYNLKKLDELQKEIANNETFYWLYKDLDDRVIAIDELVIEYANKIQPTTSIRVSADSDGIKDAIQDAVKEYIINSEFLTVEQKEKFLNDNKNNL